MQLSGPLDLIKKSIRIFFEKKNLVYFLKIYSPLIPFALFSAFQKNFNNPFAQSSLWMSGLSLFGGLASLIVYFLVGLSGLYGVNAVVAGGIPDVRAVYRTAWKNLWKFSLLVMVTFLIVVGGIILLIIPGIVFGVWYSFSRFLFVEKNTGIKESLAGSKALVAGRFWKVFGRFFVFGLFAILVQIVAGIVPFGLGSVITTMVGALFILPPYLLYQELKS